MANALLTPELDCRLDLPCLLKSGSEGILGPHDVGIVLAEDTFPVGEDGLWRSAGSGPVRRSRGTL